MADDLGWGELNSYGNDFNETPNLNKLASQGLRFSQAYAAAPVCSPTRASLMTGQYPARVGITDFLAPKSDRYLEPENYVTINEALSKAGYYTGMIGKWHLDTHFDENKGSPKNHGFDEVIGTETKYIGDGDYFYPYNKVNTLKGNEGEFLPDRLATEAVSFIERNKKEPFYLYLSHFSVHTSLDAPEKLVEKYKKKFNEKYGAGEAQKLFDGQKKGRHRADEKDNPYLAAMLERIDNGVGEIMQALKDNGIENNTLLVFFSDNGGARNAGDNGYLRGHKLMLYEGGIREPLIMRWPGKIAENSIIDYPISSVDFYPTFLEIANTEKPEDYKLDGVSLYSLITKNKKPERKTLFWHYPSETANSLPRMASAVRDGDFKLIEFYSDNRQELYNLKNDPQEKQDLSEKNPEKLAELHNLLTDWKKEVNARIPDIKK
jgi:arylsulfatase A-like enzyme